MKKIIFSILALPLLLAISIDVKSQDNNLFYHMSSSPQSYLLNPANVNDNAKVVLALPGLSHINFGLHSTFSVATMAQREGNALVIDFDKIYNTLPKVNYITQSFNMPLIDFQYRLSDKVFSFSVTENQLFDLQFDRELIGLASKGNAGYIGNKFSANFDAGFLHYRAYSFGYTQDVIEGLTVGGKLKLLTGFSAFEVAESKLEITTDSDIEYIEIAAQGRYNTSLPIALAKNADGILEPSGLDNINIGGYIGNFSNLGFGVDVGARYIVTPQIAVSASIVDLGFIGWRSGLTNLEHQGSFKWRGLDFSNSIDEGDQNYVPFNEMLENITDSVMSLIDFDITNDPFSTGIPTKVYIGGVYRFDNTYSVGLVDRLMFYNGRVSNAITLSGNAQYGKVLGLTASYAVIGNSYANLGFAASLKLGPVGLLLATDNILAFTNPLTSKHMNLSMGVNFMFGQK